MPSCRLYISPIFELGISFAQMERKSCRYGRRFLLNTTSIEKVVITILTTLHGNSKKL